MRNLFLIFFFSLTFLSFAQSRFPAWEEHFSYNKIVDLTSDSDKLYVASENAVFVYNHNTYELNTITSLDGLAGEMISSIAYSKDWNTLLIGYETGLIETVNLENATVKTYIDIVDKHTIQPNKKKINHFSVDENLAYVSTDYGISVLNLERQEFGDTYYIGYLGSHLAVNQAQIHGDYIYAATIEGIKRASLNSGSLIDYSLWLTLKEGEYRQLQSTGEQLYALLGENRIEKLDGENFELIYTDNTEVRGISASETHIVLYTYNRVEAFDLNFQHLGTYSVGGTEFSSAAFSSAWIQDGVYYIGTDKYGVLAKAFSGGQALQILPDGPLQNNVFAVEAQHGVVWASYGAVNYSFNPYPLQEKGVSKWDGEQWTNLPFESLFGANSLVKIKINPQHPETVFFNSYQKGLLELYEDVPYKLYNQTNSPLEMTNNSESYGIRLYGLDFDHKNNLWFVQTRMRKGLHKLSEDGQITSYDLEGVLPYDSELALTDLVVSKEGNVFFGTAENGLVGYNPVSRRFHRVPEGSNGGFPAYAYIYAMDIDQQGRLWIGTGKGLRVIQNTSNFFNPGANPTARQIIIMDGDVPQELLFEVPINAIHVDGANNKWIATATSGVFYVSANGQETIHHFTKANSPLPSNDIQDVTVDPVTGKVFFATTHGLMSFQGSATAAHDDLKQLHAYPNPVRPEYQGQVTIAGLMENTNVKITDLEGNLVFEATSQGGTVQWDTRAFGKHKVASGVYFVMANARDGQTTKVAKIMIIR